MSGDEPLSSYWVRSLLRGSLANACRLCEAQFLDLLHGLVEIANGLGGLKLAALLLVLGKMGVGVPLGAAPVPPMPACSHAGLMTSWKTGVRDSGLGIRESEELVHGIP